MGFFPHYRQTTSTFLDWHCSFCTHAVTKLKCHHISHWANEANKSSSLWVFKSWKNTSEKSNFMVLFRCWMRECCHIWAVNNHLPLTVIPISSKCNITPWPSRVIAALFRNTLHCAWWVNFMRKCSSAPTKKKKKKIPTDMEVSVVVNAI